MSHVGIRGNEAADGAVKRAAAGLTVTRHVLPSLQQVKAKARKAVTQHTQQGHRQLEGSKTQAAWYATAFGYHPLDAVHKQP
ncbi:hypothetical protein E2C01_051350 [Portunus trituberculatus]|uniref:RNase H type-1 domain-containing protein n=1 Tax=Portunus trituberculatus TaxID=210409 RepID=A0A5B7GBC8_PORTR|nr:hypothetical protein [Portunus trituberculatus]